MIPVTRQGAGRSGVRVAGLGAALALLATLFWAGNFDFAAGDLVILLATVVFGGYTVLVARKPDELPIAAFVFSTFAIGLLMLLPAYLVELSVTGPFPIDPSNTAALLYVGMFPSLVAFYSWNRAITTIGSTRPAVIYYLVPVFT